MPKEMSATKYVCHKKVCYKICPLKTEKTVRHKIQIYQALISEQRVNVLEPSDYFFCLSVGLHETFARAVSRNNRLGFEDDPDLRSELHGFVWKFYQRVSGQGSGAVFPYIAKIRTNLFLFK